ncbi:hypothetical protein BKA70DRAFT_1291179 [Coprinopsis sp. MPI-PUGE-AT-0042]|nr:hypothetical protein BKA70DRAFT_1291179 [Coprinopsis sp. MPI-PUGE-AT-0042]
MASPPSLSNLPIELVEEIIAQVADDAPVRGHSIHNNPGATAERHATVKSLMQTCQSLRSILFPRYWQSIELDSSHEFITAEAGVITQARQAELAGMALRELRLATTIPRVAQHVQVLNINLVQPNLNVVTAELIHCMSSCPNLHTVQLICNFFGIVKRRAFIEAFSGKEFPNIITASVGPFSLPLVTSFPNLKHLHWWNRFEREYKDLKMWLGKVPNLEGFYGLSPGFILEQPDDGAEAGTTQKKEELKTLFGNVHTLQLDLTREKWFTYKEETGIKPEAVLEPLISSLPKLRHLRLRLQDPEEKRPMLIKPITIAQNVEFVDVAKRFMSRKGGEGRKSLLVLHDRKPRWEIAL